MRSDPMLSAARFINAARGKAVKHNSLASVGIISAFPGSVNTIPEKVMFSLDLRSRDEKLLKQLEAVLRSGEDWRPYFETSCMIKNSGDYHLEVENRKSILGDRCYVDWQVDSISHAVKFDESCIQCVEDSVKASFGGESTLTDVSERMVSGAGASLMFSTSLVLTQSFHY